MGHGTHFSTKPLLLSVGVSTTLTRITDGIEASPWTETSVNESEAGRKYRLSLQGE